MDGFGRPDWASKSMALWSRWGALVHAWQVSVGLHSRHSRIFAMSVLSLLWQTHCRERMIQQLNRMNIKVLIFLFCFSLEHNNNRMNLIINPGYFLLIQNLFYFKIKLINFLLRFTLLIINTVSRERSTAGFRTERISNYQFYCFVFLWNTLLTEWIWTIIF